MLVVLQAALSLVLLVGRTPRNLRSEDLGADRSRLLLVWTLPGQTGLRGESLRSLVTTVHDRLASIPGVRMVSESGTGLLTGSSGGPRVRAANADPNDTRGIAVDGSMTAGPGFFGTIGQPLLFGREFTRRDADTSARVVILNESLAQRLFGVENAVGRHPISGPEGGGETYEVVGVVKDARYRDPRQPAGLMTYWPLLSSGRAPRVAFVVRTESNGTALVSAMRREVRAANATLPVLEIDMVDEQLDGLLFQERLIADFSAFFGVLALLLASVGLFGAVSYAAARRTREIGIRMALGAVKRDVVMQVLDDSMRLVVVALLAAFVPARRAAAVDPSTALRVD
jgi:hypothetical protein